MKKIILVLAIAASFIMSGCSRIETGEVGLRQGFDKQIQKTELQPGSFNQTMVGEVLVFPIKRIGINIKGLQPQTSDGSTLADLDITVIYDINPAAVFDLYTVQSRTFHALNDHNEPVLMYNYLTTVANSAAFKAVNKFDALGIAKQRTSIENDIQATMTVALQAEKLNMALTIVQVQVKNILPAQSIIDSANNVINLQNTLRAKQAEVDIAEKEAKRLTLLSSNHQNIDYMNANSMAVIAQAVLAGKVNTILFPVDFKGMVNVGK